MAGLCARCIVPQASAGAPGDMFRPPSDDLKSDLRDECVILVFRSIQTRVSALLAIRIKSTVRRDYSLDTLLWIDGIALNAEIISLIFQNEGVAAGGQFQCRIFTMEFIHFRSVIDRGRSERE